MSRLRGQQEEYQLEREELKAELDLMRAKVRRLGEKVSGVETEENHESLGADSSSAGEPHILSVRAPVFRPRDPVSVSSGASTRLPLPSALAGCSGTSPSSVASALVHSVTILPSTGGISSSPVVGVATSTLPVSLPPVVASPTVAASVVAVSSATIMTPVRQSVGTMSTMPHISSVLTPGMASSPVCATSPAPVLSSMPEGGYSTSLMVSQSSVSSALAHNHTTSEHLVCQRRTQPHRMK